MSMTDHCRDCDTVTLGAATVARVDGGLHGSQEFEGSPRLGQEHRHIANQEGTARPAAGLIGEQLSGFRGQRRIGAGHVALQRRGVVGEQPIPAIMARDPPPERQIPTLPGVAAAVIGNWLMESGGVAVSFALKVPAGMEALLFR